jgi:hypothetical protein
MRIFQSKGSDAERWASIRADGKRAFIGRFVLRFAPPMIVVMLAWFVLGEPLVFGDPPPLGR